MTHTGPCALLRTDPYRMKSSPLLIALAATWLAGAACAQDRIYRCGNEYTNTVTQEQAKNCKLISGGNVTIVQSHRPNPPTSAPAASAGQRVDAADQRAKDSDARRILEAELKKAEARRAELLGEYNNGEPERLGPESRNNQKYLDRVAELKAAIARIESDIAGLRRELARVAGAPGSAPAKQ